MTVRHHPRLGLVAFLCAITLVMPAYVPGQTPSSSAAEWTVPYTSWGDPDLQGVWTTDWERSVPFERPVQFGERAELTSEEIAERAEREAAALADDGPRREGSTGAGPEHWYEFGKQVSSRTSLVVDPPDGRLPPLTLGARTRQIDPSTRIPFLLGSRTGGPYNGPEDLHLADRCITRGLPHTWQPSAYNNGFQIVQSPGYVALLFERLHEHRIISLDGRAGLTPHIRQIFGDSRGHWDGDTLVVVVTNFSDQTNYRGSGSTRRLVERYTRVGHDTVRVEITVDDPVTWTKPWTMVLNGRHDPDYWQVFEYACHEGNYGMTNILSAARNLEKERGEGR